MDGQAQVRLVFAGELLEGHALDEVKRLFGEMFKLEGDRLSAVFSGQRTVLKHQIGREDGERYVDRLRKLGMRVLVEPVESLPELKPVPAAVAAPPAEVVPKPAEPPVGGLSLQELADEIQCPNCGNRQQKKFVLCKQCNTDIPRALASKAEDAERARAERQAAREQASGRYAPPGTDVDDGESYTSDDAPPFWGLRYSGRMGRINYLLSGYTAILLFGLIGVGGVLLVQLTPFLGIVTLPLSIVYVVWALRASVLRLHDVNRSGWWALIFLLPLLPFLPVIFSGGRSVPGATAMTFYLITSGINFLGGVTLLIYPGTHGDNDFGGPARRGNGVLAVIATLAFVLIFALYMHFAFKAYNGYVERAKGRQAARQQADDSREPTAPAAVPQGPMPRMPAGPAADVYRDQYVPAANEKAFAVSSAGAYGWSSGKGSTREAMSAALSDCDNRRDAYTGQCRIVSVNGMAPKER